jgi:hypothetical protein
LSCAEECWASIAVLVQVVLLTAVLLVIFLAPLAVVGALIVSGLP